MILSAAKCALTVNVLLGILDLVIGLKCFECTLSEKGCDRPTENNITITDCRRSLFTLVPDNTQARIQGTEKDDFQCLTTVERNKTLILYTRRCALKSEISLCQVTNKDNFGVIFEKCSLCGQDYCNSSTVYRVSNIFLYLVIGLVIKINGF